MQIYTKRESTYIYYRCNSLLQLSQATFNQLPHLQQVEEEEVRRDSLAADTLRLRCDKQITQRSNMARTKQSCWLAREAAAGRTA